LYCLSTLIILPTGFPFPKYLFAVDKEIKALLGSASSSTGLPLKNSKLNRIKA